MIEVTWCCERFIKETANPCQPGSSLNSGSSIENILGTSGCLKGRAWSRSQGNLRKIRYRYNSILQTLPNKSLYKFITSAKCEIQMVQSRKSWVKSKRIHGCARSLREHSLVGCNFHPMSNSYRFAARRKSIPREYRARCTQWTR